MSDKAIPQLASEIRTLAHRGWEHLPNTEVLFRAIGERAQKISELAVECMAPAPQPSDDTQWIKPKFPATTPEEWREFGKTHFHAATPQVTPTATWKEK